MNLLLAGVTAGVIVKVIVDHEDFVKRAAPYRAMIKAASEKYNVGASLIAAVLWQESRFNPKAVSPKDAKGIAQFLPIGFKDVQNIYPEFRQYSFEAVFDPKVAIPACAAMLRINIDRTGSAWTSVRAYNQGIGNAKASSENGVNYAVDVFRNATIDSIYMGVTYA